VAHETLVNYRITPSPKKIAVIGADPAGMSYATVAVQRGYHVSLFDTASEIGGQFNLAKQVSGKEEFYETLRYYKRMLEIHNVDVRLDTTVSAAQLKQGNFNHVIVATGIRLERQRSKVSIILVWSVTST
jgi:2,4-dienoyl-CoA reductase (NADPH2)